MYIREVGYTYAYIQQTPGNSTVILRAPSMVQDTYTGREKDPVFRNLKQQPHRMQRTKRDVNL